MDIDETKEKEDKKVKKFITKTQNRQEEINDETINEINMKTDKEKDTTTQNNICKDYEIIKMEIDTKNKNNNKDNNPTTPNNNNMEMEYEYPTLDDNNNTNINKEINIIRNELLH